MKIKLFVLLLPLLSLLACDKQEKRDVQLENCEQNTRTCEDDLKKCEIFKEKYEDLKTLHESLFPIPDDVDIIEIEDIEDPSSYQTKRNFDVEGGFDFKNDQIEIKIPVSTKKLKIVNYFSISTTKTNVLLIVLDGNNGIPNSNKPDKYFIKKKFKINKTGLKKQRLINDNKLKVIILHDDNFNSGHVIALQRCIQSNDGYGDSCYDIILPKMVRPNEIGGDIVP